jgi:LPXTG-motif cell wall-anchored protein
VAVIAVFGALFALPMLAAGAQEGGPPPTPDCVIDNPTMTTVTFPTTVTVSGTLSLPAHLTLFSQAPPETGPVVSIQQQDFPAGSWSFTVNNVAVPTAFSVGITFGNGNAYTGACANVAGSNTVTVSAAEAASQPAAALAFTGSSDTPSFMLIGIAALVVGAVLVIAARRRSQVS